VLQFIHAYTEPLTLRGTSAFLARLRDEDDDNDFAALAFCASSARCRTDCEVTAPSPAQSIQAGAPLHTVMAYVPVWSGAPRLILSFSTHQAVSKFKPLRRFGKHMSSSRASFPIGLGADTAGHGIERPAATLFSIYRRLGDACWIAVKSA
jgi:hypothetical protein